MSFAATWIDLEVAIHSEVNQTPKEKYMILLIFGMYKKCANEFTEHKQSYRCRKQTCLLGDREREGINWENGTPIYAHGYI